jgi:hypothetical protein
MLGALQNARSGTSADLRCWYQASDLNYQPSKNRRLNGVEYLRFNGIPTILLIASIHGLLPVWLYLAGEFDFRFPPATCRALNRVPPEHGAGNRYSHD